MIIFLAVLATAPPVDSSLSFGGCFENLGCCVGHLIDRCFCNWCIEKKGVYSDREEAEEGGNITAIDIKKSRSGFIAKIRLR